MTPKQYLMDLRIDNAKVLLKQSKDSIKSIANRVGYKDSLTFSRAFRQAAGISPKQYRNSKEKSVNKELP
jgi:AraC-like DNA-binding protein